MRTLLGLGTALVCGIALLAGCAGMHSLSSDVSSFGEWPADRQPGSYAFDRLPSQQAQAADIDRLENAVRPSLERAGFKPAPEGAAPDVLVQVGAHVRRSDYYPWSDPLWWNGGFGYWRHGPWVGPYWGGYWGYPGYYPGYYGGPRYDREVALLLRDRVSGKPLFEAHASNDSYNDLDDQSLGAMFTAAMLDFPRLGINPRRVVVSLEPPPPEAR